MDADHPNDIDLSMRDLRLELAALFGADLTGRLIGSVRNSTAHRGESPRNENAGHTMPECLGALYCKASQYKEAEARLNIPIFFGKGEGYWFTTLNNACRALTRHDQGAYQQVVPDAKTFLDGIKWVLDERTRSKNRALATGIEGLLDAMQPLVERMLTLALGNDTTAEVALLHLWSRLGWDAVQADRAVFEAQARSAGFTWRSFTHSPATLDKVQEGLSPDARREWSASDYELQRWVRSRLGEFYGRVLDGYPIGNARVIPRTFMRWLVEGRLDPPRETVYQPHMRSLDDVASASRSAFGEGQPVLLGETVRDDQALGSAGQGNLHTRPEIAILEKETALEARAVRIRELREWWSLYARPLLDFALERLCGRKPGLPDLIALACISARFGMLDAIGQKEQLRTLLLFDAKQIERALSNESAARLKYNAIYDYLLADPRIPQSYPKLAPKLANWQNASRDKADKALVIGNRRFLFIGSVRDGSKSDSLISRLARERGISAESAQWTALSYELKLTFDRLSEAIPQKEPALS